MPGYYDNEELRHTHSWEGTYYPTGGTAGQSVQVFIQTDGLELMQAEDHSVWWPYRELQLGQRSVTGGPTRVERQSGQEVLLVASPQFLKALRDAASRRGVPMGWKKSDVWIGSPLPYAVLAGLLVVAVLWIWVIPAASNVLSAHLPANYERRLGLGVSRQLAPEHLRCQNQQAVNVVESIIRKLLAGRNSPYEYHVAIMPSPYMNAFAAPAGYVTVYSGLIAASERPEELAGVLAHEIQHVELRHSVKAMQKELGMRTVLSFTFGAIGGAVISSLNSLEYHRSDEEEADRHALDLLRAAKVDPQGIVRMFQKLHAQEGNMPKFMRHLSTHPDTAGRIATLREIIAGHPYKPEPLLAHLDWNAMRQACPAVPQRAVRTR